MSTHVRGGGFEFSVCSVGGKWEWRVVADNIRGAGQLYSVDDVRTPFGPLTTAAIPIPGEVVLAMADSLTQFQQQLQPKILVTSGASFAVTVTEGDPIFEVGHSIFTNVGAFGSFMSVTASPDSPWVSVDPPTSAGIDKNQSGSTTVRIDPRILLATASPYLGHVNLQDNANNVIAVPITVTVLPRPAIGVDSPSVTLAYYLASQASGGAASVVITNAGPLGSFLSFTLAKVQNQSPWLAIAPSSGTSIPSGGTANVTLSLVNGSVPQIPGLYTETLRVASPNASNSPQEITVNLQVNP